MAMEIIQTSTPEMTTPAPITTSTIPNSLKKIKRETAQRRKAHARSLRLHAEEDHMDEQGSNYSNMEEEYNREMQEQPHNGYDPDHEQEQVDQRIAVFEHQCNGKDRNTGVGIVKADSSNNLEKKTSTGWKGRAGNINDQPNLKEIKQQDSRRRLARGPRSGATVAPETMQTMFLVPSEDHRVVSTEYQCGGTQVLMRVTLLAAGFVIGARGISARLIGQATGAIVQSWTETNCNVPDALPIRLFRIQGKKQVVQDAVNLIEQAVAKYRDLCECKRRGEFVQREHVINGVEFYYQPPPRKALTNDNNLQKLNNSCEDHQPPLIIDSPIFPSPAINPNPNPHIHHNNPSNPNLHLHTHNHPRRAPHNGPNPKIHHFMGLHPPAFPPNNVWTMHQFHNQEQRYNNNNNNVNSYHQQMAPMTGRHEDNSKSSINDLPCVNVNLMGTPGLFDWKSSSHEVPYSSDDQLHQPAVQLMMSSSRNVETPKEQSEIPEQPHNSIASLEESLKRICLDGEEREGEEDDDEEDDNTRNTNQNKGIDPWSLLTQQRHDQMSSSLFSFFGHGGLPVPVASQTPCRSSASDPINKYSNAPASPFDFSSYDFLGGRFPSFSFASAINSQPLTICSAIDKEHKSINNQNDEEHQFMCMLCIHRHARVRLTGCGHCTCISCIEGLIKCPICGEEISSVEQLDSKEPANPSPTLNGSCYHLWDWSPETSP